MKIYFKLNAEKQGGGINTFQLKLENRIEKINNKY